MVARLLLSDSGYQILSATSRLPDPGYQILAAGCWLPDAGFPILASRSWLADPVFFVVPILIFFTVWGLAPGSFCRDESIDIRNYYTILFGHRPFSSS